MPISVLPFPSIDPVLVNIGPLAVKLLAKLGYSVVAVTGKEQLKPRLYEWGAGRVLSRQEAINTSDRPLLSARDRPQLRAVIQIERRHRARRLRRLHRLDNDIGRRRRERSGGAVGVQPSLPQRLCQVCG